MDSCNNKIVRMEDADAEGGVLVAYGLCKECMRWVLEVAAKRKVRISS